MSKIWGRGRGIFTVHAGRPCPDKMMPLAARTLEEPPPGYRRQQDADGPSLTHSAGNQLDKLRSKIENRNDFDASRDTGDSWESDTSAQEIISVKRPHRIPSVVTTRLDLARCQISARMGSGGPTLHDALRKPAWGPSRDPELGRRGDLERTISWSPA